jgi:hypothetical protein
MVGLFLALKGRYIKSQIKHVTPFQGEKTCLIFTQGAALGWYVAALSGLRKTISDFMRSVFYSPAILVTLI